MVGKLFSDYPIDFYGLRIVVAVDKNNETTYSFPKKFVDITPQPVSIKTFDDVNRWYDDSMLYYCQQYKFALWCATAGCGVSKDQLTRGLPLTRALMNFHVMFQTKKILAQMEIKNPNDQDFHPYNNPYNKTEYRKLLNEFGIKASDIPEIDQPAGGLGFCIRNFGPTAKALDESGAYHHNLPTYPATGKTNEYLNIQKSGGDWNSYFTFGGTHGYPIEKVQQDVFDYKRVVPDHSASFTNSGIVRLNDSIRAYVYSLLGAQVQARRDGALLESQQQFLAIVNDLINEKQSLEESIKNFENALSETVGIINYVVAKGLYVIPANMNLNELGRSVKGFNDELQLVRSFDGVGIKPPPKPQPPKPKFVPSKPVRIAPTPKPASPKPASPKPAIAPPKVVSRNERDVHNGNKTSIIGGIVAAGVAYKTLY